MDGPFLPYGRQCIDDDDVKAVAEVCKSDWLTTGPAVSAFENSFAAKTGCRYAVACANGTAGLHLAALALGLKEGDRVLVPTLTFLATANAARYVGAEVEFVDVNPDTGLMDTDALRQLLSDDEGKSIKAVFPVHLNGYCADMAAIGEIAKDHGLAVVEDACHGLGGADVDSGGNLVPVGSCALSDMSVFSLHPVKIATMGEGGVVTTNDESCYRRLQKLRSHGISRQPETFQNKSLAFAEDGSPNPWYHEMPELGFNYRASDIACALGSSQLNKLEKFVDRRRALATLYDQHLESLAPLVRPVDKTATGNPVLHLYVVLIDFKKAGIERADVMRRLHDEGIGTQVHYLPVHLQPYYRKRYGEITLDGANAYYERCLSLPYFPDMEDEDVVRVTKSLQQILTSEAA